jgi:hypothetical protein
MNYTRSFAGTLKEMEPGSSILLFNFYYLNGIVFYLNFKLVSCQL